MEILLMWSFYLYLWLACGIVAAIIGARKGEGFLAFIMGVFLGPIGVLIAILSSGNQMSCPSCKEKINKKAIICPHCRSNIPPQLKSSDSLATSFIQGIAILIGILILFVIIGEIFKGNSTPSYADPNTQEPSQEPQSPASNWNYHDKQDKFNERVVHIAKLESTNTENLNMPLSENGRASIQFENSKERGLKLFFNVHNGQFNCEPDGCIIKVRFDDKKPVSFSAEMPSDYDTQYLYIPAASKFIKALAEAKTVAIEASYFQAGKHAFDFDVAGLDKERLGLVKPKSAAKQQEKVTPQERPSSTDENIPPLLRRL